MTVQQVEAVRASWKLVLPIQDEAGKMFYDKLFTTAPGIRHMFKPDITHQANKLMQVLGYVVSKLHRMDELLPEVQKLGAKHQGYGAHPEHYEVVGQCLIATLKDGLGSHWNAETQDAWVTAFNTLKNVMIIAQEAECKESALSTP
jgi:methyl-accepting chemotaxis protein